MLLVSKMYVVDVMMDYLNFFIGIKVLVFQLLGVLWEEGQFLVVSIYLDCFR